MLVKALLELITINRSRAKRSAQPKVNIDIDVFSQNDNRAVMLYGLGNSLSYLMRGDNR